MIGRVGGRYVLWGSWLRFGIVVGGLVLAGAVVWVLGPGVAWWLEHVDGVTDLTGKDRAEALDRVRGRAMALGTGLLATAAIYYTASNAASARRTAEAAHRSAEIAEAGQLRAHELTERGQVTDRYTRAIEQLGSEKLDLRLGGIFALERIAWDSARDHPVVMAVLAAFVREHCDDLDAHGPAADPPTDGGNLRVPRARLRSDLQAALAVIGRRVRDHDGDIIDLSHVNLSRAELVNANLKGVDLNGADLSRARLVDADLVGVSLINADLSEAHLSRADLSAADLTQARMSKSRLLNAKLRGARLTRANLTESNLSGADLTGARLTGSQLGGAYLGGTNLTDADLTGADLRKARGPRPEAIREIALTDDSTRFE